MNNEVLLLISVPIIFSTVLLIFKYFGKTGLFAATVFLTITANIEVLILVDAFGLEQTLGNVLFAATFLCTDIASELYGRKTANQIVNIGITSSFLFIILSQSWLHYIPSPNDFMMPHMTAVFSNTPRLMLVGLSVYAISQKIDVFLYELIWKKTADKFADKHRFLWLRNNGSTLLSQFLNTVLFTFGAFYGIFPIDTLMSIVVSTYVIFVILAILDTSFVYFARRLFEKGKVNEL